MSDKTKEEIEKLAEQHAIEMCDHCKYGRGVNCIKEKVKESVRLRFGEFYASQQTAELEAEVKRLMYELEIYQKPNECGLFMSSSSGMNCDYCGKHYSTHRVLTNNCSTNP